MSGVVILPLSAAHAHDAARLHMAGQPGTFLTSLGHEALTTLYRTLPQSPTGFGFAAEWGDGRLFGFVSAAVGTGSLFAHVLVRRMGEFAPILARRFAARPRLLIHAAQAALYPLLAADHSGEGVVAELLSIMVEAEWRSQGVGALLLAALLAECSRRNVVALDVTVDAANMGAQRFYERHHFRPMRVFPLFGRAMYLYRRSLQL